MLGVSRQAIVNDIAILRASGQAIIGGPHGYRVGRVSGLIEVIHCNHQPDRGREEWKILLYRGIAALDVGVDHSVFGETGAPVVVETRADIDRHAATITAAGEAPLSVMTGGRHTHTVRAPNQDALDAAKRELRERGILDQPADRKRPAAGGPDRGSERVTLRAMDERDRTTTDSGIELHPCTAPTTSWGSTRRSSWASRGSRRSRAASTRRCTGSGCGRCASTPAWAPPPRRTGGSATCWTRGRPGCRWRSTCRRRWASTRTIRAPRARSGRRAWRSTRSTTCGGCSRASRSTASPRR